MNKDVYILDGYGLIYRSYFALINRPLTDRDGKNITGIYAFIRHILSLQNEYSAEKIIVALDSVGPTFRHQQYSEYKANRDSAPEDLHAQVPLIEEMLGFLGIPVVRMDGFEADDIMGSVADYCNAQGIVCRLISSDKDLMQLVGGTVSILRPGRGIGLQHIGVDEVLAEKGVKPEQFIDYLALVGDASDNIPGVAGIGPKTASALISEWGSMDELYNNLETAARGSKLAKLIQGQEDACLSRHLVTIRRDLDIADVVHSAGSLPVDIHSAISFCRDRDMKTLMDEITALHPEYSVSGDSSHQLQSTTYTAVLTTDQLDFWRKKILEAGTVALDTETDNRDPMQASLVGLSFAVDSTEAAYLPLRRPDGECLEKNLVIEWLTEVFCNNPIRIIGQNFKYDMKVLRRAGVPIGSAWFDTMIAAWVLDASSPVGMDALASRYLNTETTKFSSVVPKGGTFDDVPLDKAVEYAAEDAVITLDLYKHFMPLMDTDEDISRVFWNYEMPLLPILTEMEMKGIGLDIFELEAYSEELRDEIHHLTKKIHSLCGKEFNIASSKQLQKILFEERGLTPGKKTKTGYSTDNSVLSTMVKEDPLPEQVLLYRSLTKLKSTYVDTLPRLVHPQDGRIHTSYSQTGSATGRLSSNNPNLQNIPIRDENGRRIRKAFKSIPGCQFISADYSQIELVILAHISGDTALTEAFRTQIDVHAQTAALLHGIDTSEVTSEQRRLGKVINFGVMYGMSAFRLSNELRISRKEAKHFIDAYFLTYSGVKSFINEAVKNAERDSGIRTMYGRVRPLPGINSRNRIEKSAAERAAVNSIIQGTAADIMKLAMISVDRVLKEHHPTAQMLLQVHDELLIEAQEPEIPLLSSRVKSAMEEVVELSVPLCAEVEAGTSWGDIH